MSCAQHYPLKQQLQATKYLVKYIVLMNALKYRWHDAYKHTHAEVL